MSFLVSPSLLCMTLCLSVSPLIFLLCVDVCHVPCCSALFLYYFCLFITLYICLSLHICTSGSFCICLNLSLSISPSSTTPVLISAYLCCEIVLSLLSVCPYVPMCGSLLVLLFSSLHAIKGFHVRHSSFVLGRILINRRLYCIRIKYMHKL